MAAPEEDELDDLLSSLDAVDADARAPEPPKPMLPGPALGAPRAGPTIPATPRAKEMDLDAALSFEPDGASDSLDDVVNVPPPAFDSPLGPVYADADPETETRFPRVESDTGPPPIVDLTPRPELMGRQFEAPSTLADIEDSSQGEDGLPPIRTPLPPSPVTQPPSLDDEPEDAPAAQMAAGTSPRKPPPELPTATADLSLAGRGLPTVVWVGLISFAVAGLGTILYSQVDAFHPEREATRVGIAETEQKRALEEHRRKQPVPAEIVIEADVDEAAVWLLLGRTPLESISFPSNQVHEVRFELEGWQTLDAVIDRSHWAGEGEAAVAELLTKLRRGKSSSPAYPPQGAVKPPAGPKGRGPLVLESDPPGARVWLLVGFTPEVRVTGIETNRRYELKVLKDGHRPAFAVVKAEGWIVDGTKATRRVTLPPLRAGRN